MENREAKPDIGVAVQVGIAGPVAGSPEALAQELAEMIKADTKGGLRRVVSIEKARELTGVSRRTIYNWMAKGSIQWCRTAGGNVRIYLDTLFRDGRQR